MGNIERGCECTDCHASSGCTGSNAPVAYLVDRDGETLRVCTRCELSGDDRLETLVEHDTPAQPYLDYDPLGALTLSSGFDEGEGDLDV